MRFQILLTALAVLMMVGSALSQSGMSADPTTHVGGMMNHRPTFSDHLSRDRRYGPRLHAFGAMRSPTVGDIANQRVNGG